MRHSVHAFARSAGNCFRESCVRSATGDNAAVTTAFAAIALATSVRTNPSASCAERELTEGSADSSVAHDNDASSPKLRKKTRLYIVRHGETDWNVEGRVQGQLDISLNNAGVSQAQHAAKALKFAGVADRVDAIVSSDLQRASATADAIASVCPVDARRLSDARLREINFGKMQGLLASDPITSALRESVSGVWRTGGFYASHPNGECLHDVFARCFQGLRGAAEQGSEVVVVTHGGLKKWCAIGMQLARSLDQSDPPTEATVETMGSASVRKLFESAVPNCCCSVLTYDHCTGRFEPEVWFQALDEAGLDDVG
eukprot:TRINITY_DN9133_c0_g1_i1.p1 TRINITY_DN9133_c0_g1~~TRINITY_DN9133_c0_g1_i1.p1  ORF type:complete len:315 (+),score=34.67 TRINITY_DN9133_c0_g1_i1:41-985(+)